MFPLALGLTVLVSTNFLIYAIKSQLLAANIGIIILGLVICSNLLATLMPTLFSELWSFPANKVIAYSIGFWFCITCGLIVGIAT